jgi:hypothetical protein
MEGRGGKLESIVLRLVGCLLMIIKTVVEHGDKFFLYRKTSAPNSLILVVMHTYITYMYVCVC